MSIQGHKADLLGIIGRVDTFHSTQMNRPKNKPPMISMEITMGLAEWLAMGCSAAHDCDKTYDFHSK
jgi:hypothetical protein